MRPVYVFALVFLTSALAFGQETTRQPGAGAVFIIGGIHQTHERAKKYTYARMGEIYRHLHPDALCVEGEQKYIDDGAYHLMPFDFSRYMVPQAKKDGIPIAGIDWWDASGERWLELQKKSGEDARVASAEAVYGGLFQTLNDYFTDGDFVEVNAPEVTALWAAKNRFREHVLEQYPEYRFIVEFERTRNQHMADKLSQCIAAHPGKRVLVAVGIDHKFWLEEALRESGVRVLEVDDVMREWWR
jgi:hypothetical protein